MTYIYRKLTTSEITSELLNDQQAMWTYEAAKALAAVLSSTANAKGKPLELDHAQVRSEYSEYDSLRELQQEFEHLSVVRLKDFVVATLRNGGVIVKGL